MSSVEFETPGFWSCLYCEGNWIPGSEIEALATQAENAPTKTDWTPLDHGDPTNSSTLICPDCGASQFVSSTAKGVTAHCCKACHGVFLPKGALNVFQPLATSASAPEVLAAAVVIKIVSVIFSIAIS
jgi:Zn-finger nucleic acid-binding protein